MSLFEQIALGFQALRFTALALFRPRLWTPWLMLGAIQLSVVLALWRFAHPVLSWFMAPLLSQMAGEGALHYPRVFELMPTLYDRADVLIGILFGSVAIGMATPLFAAQFHGEAPAVGHALSEGARRAVALILVQLPLNLAVAGLSIGVTAWLEHRGRGITTHVLGLAVTGASLAVQALFFYAAARVMLKGEGPLAAWRGLARSARQGFLPAFVAGTATVILLLPVHWLAGQVLTVVERGRPELAGWLTLMEAAGGLLNSFLLTGSATLIFLSALDSREEEW